MKTIELIQTPKNGSTYLWDASINTSAWLNELFGEPLDLDIPNEAWDNDSVVRGICENHASVEANESIQLVEATRENVVSKKEKNYADKSDTFNTAIRKPSLFLNISSILIIPFGLSCPSESIIIILNFFLKFS